MNEKKITETPEVNSEQQIELDLKQIRGRLPILDRKNRLVAYELDISSSGIKKRERFEIAARLLKDPGFLSSKTIFFRVDVDDLAAGHHHLLPERRVVLCVPAVTPHMDRLIDTYAHLVARGYTLALDGIGNRPAGSETSSITLQYASFVRLDLNSMPNEERLQSVIGALQKRKVRVLGIGVEDDRRREIALRNGTDIFQGFFFLKPHLLPRRQASPLTFSYMELIARLNAHDLNYDDLEEIVKSDISLSTQLLKYLSTPALGLREKVTSLHQALVLLGEKEIRKWASSLIISNLANDAPDHLNTLALVRGRFCESIAELTGREEESLDHYMVGLLSLVDVITHQPVDELTLAKGITSHVRLALLGSKNHLGQVLALTRACERGDAVAAAGLATRLDIDPTQTLTIYNQALRWGEYLHAGTRSTIAA